MRGEGDLLPLIKDHYDPTLVGSKVERESYSKILSFWPSKKSALFITDNIEEAKACLASDDKRWHVLLCEREGNKALPDKLPCEKITSFDEISF